LHEIHKFIEQEIKDKMDQQHRVTWLGKSKAMTTVAGP